MPQLQHTHCTIEGCDRKHKARGYCQTHYMQFQRGEAITPVIKTRVMDRSPICTVDKCNGPEKSMGLCQMHYARQLRHGTTDWKPRWKESRGTCSIPDCGKVRYSNGLCSRHYQSNRKWAPMGLTAHDYQDMLTKQGGTCLICEEVETSIDPGTQEVRALAVDHNHTTMTVRGLLCSACNVSIGLMKEDPARLRKAAAYLEHFDISDLL